MFSKKIKFKASQSYIDNNQDVLPIPSKLNIPEWYKKLNHGHKKPTVKGCIPFLDSLTAGYILKMPVDYYVEHNITFEGEKKTSFKSSFDFINDETIKLNLNKNGNKDYHSVFQIEGSSYVEKNRHLPIHKIYNPWVIETPPGYSTLFIPIMNNQDDRFSIIPGIVDTDTHNIEVNFPIIFNGDKYKELITTIKRGTPYVQLFPFKRDDWKMTIESIEEKKLDQTRAHWRKIILNNYKNYFWNKKSWK